MSLDHHPCLAIQATCSVLPHIGRHPTHGQRRSLQRTIVDTQLTQLCLIDQWDGHNLMNNLEFFFKSFSFYLFKSFSFYQMISNCYQNLNFIFILSLVLIFHLSTKCVPSILHNQMALYAFLVMLSRSSQNQTQVPQSLINMFLT